MTKHKSINCHGTERLPLGSTYFVIRFQGLKIHLLQDKEDHSELDTERFRDGNYFKSRKDAIDFLKYKIAELDEKTETIP